MHIYIRIYIHTHTQRTHTYTQHTHTHTHTHTSVWMYGYISARMYVWCYGISLIINRDYGAGLVCTPGCTF
jgi:hypothetical protein